MMALTHHVIVNVAARRVGRNNFTEYALLGDDLVIACEATADCYQVIMKDLGIEINLSKSLISRAGVAEFAKRLFWNGKDLSPLPPKLVSTLSKGIRNLRSVLLDMIGRGVQPQIDELQQDKRLTPNLLWELVGPLGIVDGKGLSPFLGDRSLSAEQYQTICQAVVRVINRQCIQSFYKNQNKSQDTIDKLGTLIWDGLREVPDNWGETQSPTKTLGYVTPEQAGGVQAA
jgi:hypothetical protein